MQKFPIQMRREENYNNNEVREDEIGCPEDYTLLDQTAVKAHITTQDVTAISILL
jgi:hypothetical protein